MKIKISRQKMSFNHFGIYYFTTSCGVFPLHDKDSLSIKKEDQPINHHLLVLELKKTHILWKWGFFPWRLQSKPMKPTHEKHSKRGRTTKNPIVHQKLHILTSVVGTKKKVEGLRQARHLL